MENRAFEEMRKFAVGRLRGRNYAELAEKAGAKYCAEKETITLQTLGEAVEIRLPEWELEPRLSDWHYLLVLHYLDLADGTPLSDDLMPFASLKDGLIRGGGFDRQLEQKAQSFLVGKALQRMETACKTLGASSIASNADLCAVFPFFPRYPMTLKLWLPDEELGGSGKLLVNAAADHYLTIEDAVTAGAVLWDSFTAQYDAFCGGEA